MLRFLKSALKSEAGSLAVAFAFAAAALVVAGGIALDFVHANNARAKLQAAADSAALAAANATVLSTAPRNDPARKARAADAFGINAADLATASISRPDVAITRKGGSLAAEVTFAAEIPTTFAQLIGYPSFRIAGKAVASNGGPPHVDIIAIVDNSMSMGIGQTRADQDRMLADDGILAATGNKSGPCAVACHIAAEDTYSYYRTRGVTMRIDVVRAALLKVVKGLAADNARAPKVRIAIATTEESGGSAPFVFTRDLRAAAAKAEAIELASRDGLTNLSRALKAANAAITRSGDGSTADKPLVVVLLLSDGFEHVQTLGGDYEISRDSAADPRFPAAQVMQNIAPKECDALKARGARIMMLNTSYEIPVKAWNWETGKVVDWNRIPLAADVERIRILLDKVPRTEAAMKACAGKPGHYLKASSQTDIETALGAFMDSAFIKRPFLSQ
jgi:Putative Flp pilus-assembly TadE/G-like